MIDNSSTTEICNITLDQSDLNKLNELDPNQVNGMQTFMRISIPTMIVYTTEQQQEISDIQDVTYQILTRTMQESVPGHRKAPKVQVLDHLQVYVTSQTDLYFNFVSNISEPIFQALKTKNQLNLKFNQLPNVLANMLKNCRTNGNNEAVLRLSYQGTGKLTINQATEYKKLQLIDLSFNRSTIQKSHQSIMFRFNFQKSKLHMLENSISSIYEILAKKNPPLLQLIQSRVGINE